MMIDKGRDSTGKSAFCDGVVGLVARTVWQVRRLCDRSRTRSEPSRGVSYACRVSPLALTLSSQEKY